MIYRANFSLTNCVNNFDLANLYFSQKDMTAILKNDINFPQNIKDIVEKIEWILVDLSSGYIKLTTNEELTELNRNYLSNWVFKQCKDGIGEDFRQQNFAYYDDIGLVGYEGSGWDNTLIISEFDWRQNTYPFVKIN